jgi:hypothetical protein
VVFVEAVGDVFEENEAEDDVLVFRRVHVVAELVGGEPELGLEAEVGGGVFGSGLGFGGAGHERLSGIFRVNGCYQSAWRKFWQGFQP